MMKAHEDHGPSTMGVRYFGGGRGKIGPKRAKNIQKAARKGYECAELVTCETPDDGHHYWFTVPYVGVPFDQAHIREVTYHVEKKFGPLKKLGKDES